MPKRKRINAADVIVPDTDGSHRAPVVPPSIPDVVEPEIPDPDLADWIAAQPTRESWLLERYLANVVPYLQAHDVTPPDVRLSCGWTGVGVEACTLGVCYDKSQSAADVYEIFISPTVADSAQALAVMFHELAHAIAGCTVGHDRETYGTVCRRLGLTDNDGGNDDSHAWPTCASPGAELRAWIAAVVARCEPYPHAAVVPPPPAPPVIVEKPGNHKPQSTRMLKASCESDGYVVRLTMKWATRGMPKCGICSSVMLLEADQPE